MARTGCGRAPLGRRTVAELLDQVARTLAAGGSRREALRKLGVLLAGAALAGLLPKQVQAAPPCGGQCRANQCCNNGTCIAKCPFGTCCTGGSCEKSCPGDQCCDTVNGVCVANGKCPGPNNRPGCCDRATYSPLATCLAACPDGRACVDGTCPCTPSQCSRASTGHACLPSGECGCNSAADCQAGAICVGTRCGPCSAASQCPVGQAC